MENFRKYIARSSAERRLARHSRVHEEADAIGITNSNELHTVSIFFVAGTASKESETRMDALRRKMAKFEYGDMIVVALAVGVADEA